VLENSDFEHRNSPSQGGTFRGYAASDHIIKSVDRGLATLLALVKEAWSSRGLRFVPFGEQCLSACNLMAMGRFDEAADRWAALCESFSSMVFRVALATCRAMAVNPEIRRDGFKDLEELRAQAPNSIAQASVESYLAEALARQPTLSEQQNIEAEQLARGALQQTDESNRDVALSALTRVLLRQTRFEEASVVAMEWLQHEQEREHGEASLSLPEFLVMGGPDVVASVYRAVRQLGEAEARCCLGLALVGDGRRADAALLLEEVRNLAPNIAAASELEEALREAD